MSTPSAPPLVRLVTLAPPVPSGGAAGRLDVLPSNPPVAAARPARLRDALRWLDAGDRLLTLAGLFFLALLVPTVDGLVNDPRMITGVPAWLKPAKFALSAGIYCLTLAAVFRRLDVWPRMRRVVSVVTTAVLLLEVGIIDMQAWRGTTSHFNVATPLDAALFSLMGAAIVGQTLTSVAVAVALWRTRFADTAMGWALRLGMTLTIAGALSGGLMTARPTSDQLAVVQAGGRLTTVGGHTVGGPDGGPGLPAVGWSTRHGDLRVAHFVGLHAIQVLPLVAWFVRRRQPRSQRAWVGAGIVGYAFLFAWTLMQALAGRPLVPIG